MSNDCTNESEKVRQFAKVLKIGANTLLLDSRDKHFSTELDKLRLMFPQTMHWSFSESSVRSFLHEIMLTSTDAYFDSLSIISKGKLGETLSGRSFEELARIALDWTGDCLVGTHLAGMYCTDDIDSGHYVEVVEGLRLRIGKVIPSGLSIGLPGRMCRLEMSLSAFSPSNSATLAEFASDHARHVLGVLWITDCCKFIPITAMGAARKATGPFVQLPGRDRNQVVRLDSADSFLRSLEAVCKIVLPGGLSMLDAARATWAMFAGLDDEIRTQVSRAFHFLGAALTALSAEDRIVSMCTAFECLLGWGKKSENDNSLNRFAKERMIDRAMFLTGGDSSNRKQTLKAISDLYSERSALVHGDRTRTDRKEARAIIASAEKVIKQCFMELMQRFS